MIKESNYFVWLMPFALGCIASLVYILTLSQAYDQNGVAELIEMERGFGPSWFPPNHLLFRPFLAASISIAVSLGYHGLSLGPAQALTALAGGLMVGLFAQLVNQHLKHWSGKYALILAFAGSFFSWSFSTDVYYIPVAASCAIAGYIAIFKLTQLSYPTWRWLVVSLCLTAAILFWQANLFLVFPYTVITWLWLPTKSYRLRIRALLSWLLPAILLTLTTFALIGASIKGVRIPGEFLDWLTTYPTGQLPIYGVTEINRIIPALRSAISAVLPVWGGFGLRTLANGYWTVNKIPSQLLLVASLMLGFVLVIGSLKSPNKSIYRYFVWFSVSIVSYGLFIIWWDPFEPKWWGIPLIPTWIFVGVVLKVQRVLPQLGMLTLLYAWASLLFLSTFLTVIYPRHSNSNPLFQAASQAQALITPSDLVVMPVKDWPYYLDYLDPDARVYDLFARSVHVGSSVARNELESLACETLRSQSYVYFSDTSRISPEQWEWVQTNSGIDQGYIESFKTMSAGNLKGFQIWKATNVPHCSLK